ncbi:MAG: hypothetical protein R3310_00720 [Candidatus Competibacteraceae bacterium]|nr:hypothetical protein [Candidatus Competibacteraceae bacterium]
MKRRDWRSSRFDIQDPEPLGPLANLVDIMLVFACGLIAALAAAQGGLGEGMRGGQVVEKGRELPEIPEAMGQGGRGLDPVGRVFRDPETGKLILIGEGDDR